MSNCQNKEKIIIYKQKQIDIYASQPNNTKIQDKQLDKQRHTCLKQTKILKLA